MNLTTETYQRIVAAKLFIDTNYQDAIELEQIARRAFLSRFHFHRIFTKVYRKTPHQYLTQIRLAAAKEMLAREGISITDVCNSIGFESLGSFSSLFRKQSGYSPQYYRNIAWLKKKLTKEQPKRFIPYCFIEQYKFSE
jgi:AraC-like DNA-binding protein